MVSIAMVRGDTPDRDRTWMTFADGQARRVAVHVIHDLPHLVVESLFGIEDGLWGVLARGGFAPANRAVDGRGAAGCGWSPMLRSTTWPANSGSVTWWPRP
jgi:hypothetical protein